MGLAITYKNPDGKFLKIRLFPRVFEKDGKVLTRDRNFRYIV